MVILGASFDDAPANQAFAKKYGYSFRLLCDTDKKLGRAYGAVDDKDSNWARRISYLIGPDRKIVRTYDPVKPAEHPEQVLADLPKA